jgi:ubiquitin-like protein 4
MPKVMSKPTNLAPGQEKSISVTLKSLRNPPLDIKLSSQLRNTSILDIKSSVAAQTRIPIDKMKILHKKKPISDSKVLKDLLGDEETAIEFSVMVLGGAAAVPSEADTKSIEATTSGAAAVLETAEFWADLKSFLGQRLGDEKKAEELSALFHSSWRTK